MACNDQQQLRFPVTLDEFKKCIYHEELLEKLIEVKTEGTELLDLYKTDFWREQLIKEYYELFYTKPTIRNTLPVRLKPMPKKKKDKFLEEATLVNAVGSEGTYKGFLATNLKDVEDTCERMPEDDVELATTPKKSTKRYAESVSPSSDRSNQAKRPKSDNVKTATINTLNSSVSNMETFQSHDHNYSGKIQQHEAKDHAKGILSPNTRNGIEMHPPILAEKHTPVSQHQKCADNLLSSKKTSIYNELSKQENHCPISFKEFTKYTNIKKLISLQCQQQYGHQRYVTKLTKRAYLHFYLIPQDRSTTPFCALKIAANCPENIKAKIYEMAKPPVTNENVRVAQQKDYKTCIPANKDNANTTNQEKLNTTKPTNSINLVDHTQDHGTVVSKEQVLDSSPGPTNKAKMLRIQKAPESSVAQNVNTNNSSLVNTVSGNSIGNGNHQSQDAIQTVAQGSGTIQKSVGSPGCTNHKTLSKPLAVCHPLANTIQKENRPNQSETPSSTVTLEKRTVPEVDNYAANENLSFADLKKYAHLCPVTLKHFKMYTNITELVSQGCQLKYGDPQMHLSKITKHSYWWYFLCPETRYKYPLNRLHITSNCPEDIRNKILDTTNPLAKTQQLDERNRVEILENRILTPIPLVLKASGKGETLPAGLEQNLINKDNLRSNCETRPNTEAGTPENTINDNTSKIADTGSNNHRMSSINSGNSNDGRDEMLENSVKKKPQERLEKIFKNKRLYAKYRQLLLEKLDERYGGIAIQASLSYHILHESAKYDHSLKCLLSEYLGDKSELINDLQKDEELYSKLLYYFCVAYYTNVKIREKYPCQNEMQRHCQQKITSVASMDTTLEKRSSKGDGTEQPEAISSQSHDGKSDHQNMLAKTEDAVCKEQTSNSLSPVPTPKSLPTTPSKNQTSHNILPVVMMSYSQYSKYQESNEEPTSSLQHLKEKRTKSLGNQEQQAASCSTKTSNHVSSIVEQLTSSTPNKMQCRPQLKGVAHIKTEKPSKVPIFVAENLSNSSLLPVGQILSSNPTNYQSSTVRQSLTTTTNQPPKECVAKSVNTAAKAQLSSNSNTMSKPAGVPLTTDGSNNASSTREQDSATLKTLDNLKITTSNTLKDLPRSHVNISQEQQPLSSSVMLAKPTHVPLPIDVSNSANREQLPTSKQSQNQAAVMLEDSKNSTTVSKQTRKEAVPQHKNSPQKQQTRTNSSELRNTVIVPLNTADVSRTVPSSVEQLPSLSSTMDETHAQSKSLPHTKTKTMEALKQANNIKSSQVQQASCSSSNILKSGVPPSTVDQLASSSTKKSRSSVKSSRKSKQCLESVKQKLFQDYSLKYSLAYMLRVTHGLKQRIIEVVTELNFNVFTKITRIYQGNEFDQNLDALTQLYEYVFKAPNIWPEDLFICLEDICQLLKLKKIEVPNASTILTYISPRFLHWSNLVENTNFVECVCWYYMKCLNGKLDIQDKTKVETICIEYYHKCWMLDQWVGEVPKANKTLEKMVLVEGNTLGLTNANLKKVEHETHKTLGTSNQKSTKKPGVETGAAKSDTINLGNSGIRKFLSEETMHTTNNDIKEVPISSDLENLPVREVEKSVDTKTPVAASEDVIRTETPAKDNQVVSTTTTILENVPADVVTTDRPVCENSILVEDIAMPEVTVLENDPAQSGDDKSEIPCSENETVNNSLVATQAVDATNSTEMLINLSSVSNNATDPLQNFMSDPEDSTDCVLFVPNDTIKTEPMDNKLLRNLNFVIDDDSVQCFNISDEVVELDQSSDSISSIENLNLPPSQIDFDTIHEHVNPSHIPGVMSTKNSDDLMSSDNSSSMLNLGQALPSSFDSNELQFHSSTQTVDPMQVLQALDVNLRSSGSQSSSLSQTSHIPQSLLDGDNDQTPASLQLIHSGELVTLYFNPNIAGLRESQGMPIIYGDVANPNLADLPETQGIPSTYEGIINSSFAGLQNTQVIPIKYEEILPTVSNPLTCYTSITTQAKHMIGTQGDLAASKQLQAGVMNLCLNPSFGNLQEAQRLPSTFEEILPTVTKLSTSNNIEPMVLENNNVVTLTSKRDTRTTSQAKQMKGAQVDLLPQKSQNLRAHALPNIDKNQMSSASQPLQSGKAKNLCLNPSFGNLQEAQRLPSTFEEILPTVTNPSTSNNIEPMVSENNNVATLTTKRSTRITSQAKQIKGARTDLVPQKSHALRALPVVNVGTNPAVITKALPSKPPGISKSSADKDQTRQDAVQSSPDFVPGPTSTQTTTISEQKSNVIEVPLRISQELSKDNTLFNNTTLLRVVDCNYPKLVMKVVHGEKSENNQQVEASSETPRKV